MTIQERFELYIEGLLNKEESQELERQLKSNPQFYDEFKQFAEANLLLREKLSSPLIACGNDVIIKELSLKERLMIDEDVDDYLSGPKQEGEKEFKDVIETIIHEKPGNKNPFIINTFIKIAAVFLLVFITSAIIVKINNIRGKYSPTVAFVNYYNPVKDETLQVSGVYDMIMQRAIIDFRKADYDAVNNNLNMISKDYDTEYMYHILKGLLLLENGKSDSARQFFSTAMIKAENDNRFIAKWYLGLTFLKENNYKAALPLFTELSKEDNPYRREAKSLLKKLKVQ